MIPDGFFLYAERVVKESRRGGNGGQNIQSIYQNNEGHAKENRRISRNFDEVGADGETQRPLRPSSSDITHQISRGS